MDFIKAPSGQGYEQLFESLVNSGAILLLLAALIVWILWTLWRFVRSEPARRRSWRYEKKSYRWQPRIVPSNDVSDPLQQMEFISKVDFETRPLLNTEERRVFEVLEQTVGQIAGDFRLMAQTSLGEVIATSRGGSAEDRRRAFASINSKRLDFAVFNQKGTLALAIEYQGSGHYHQKSFVRDAVKREVLRKAGVPFLEVAKGSKPAELREQVERVLAPFAARSQSA